MHTAEEITNKMCRFVMMTGEKIDGLVLDYDEGFIKVEGYLFVYDLNEKQGAVLKKMDKTYLISINAISTVRIINKWTVKQNKFRKFNGWLVKENLASLLKKLKKIRSVH